MLPLAHSVRFRFDHQPTLDVVQGAFPAVVDIVSFFATMYAAPLRLVFVFFGLVLFRLVFFGLVPSFSVGFRLLFGV